MRTTVILALCASAVAGLDFANETKGNHTLFTSEGCTTLKNSADAGSSVVKVTYKWAYRGTVVHTGLEFTTSSGHTYALAYNSQTIPSTINTPGAVWCQSGGMPMQNALANGNCPGCGGWASGEAAGGNFRSLGQFISDVQTYAASHNYYNLLACTLHGNTANCQVFASHMFNDIVGHHPGKGACPLCPGECDL